MLHLEELSDDAVRAWLPEMWRDYRRSLLLAGASESEADSNVASNRERVMDGEGLKDDHVVLEALADD